MRVGYAKLGRCMQFNATKFGFQGDAEAPQLLERLARRNPDVEWVLVGKNTGFETWDDAPANISNPWDPNVTRAQYLHRDNAHRCSFCKEEAPLGMPLRCCDRGEYTYNYERWVIEQAAQLDGFVMHLGQHGVTHGYTPIPQVNTTWDDETPTNPYVWARNYGGYLIEILNRLGDRGTNVTYLCADPRNYLKARDVKWPPRNPVLAQYEFTRTCKHERYEDFTSPDAYDPPYDAEFARENELWVARHRYTYGGIELSMLPDDWQTWGQRPFDERAEAGIATTAYWYGDDEGRRSYLVKRYLLNAFPDAELFGKWDAKSLEELGDKWTVTQADTREFSNQLGSWRVTMSLPPASLKRQDLSWCVAKPWQCFAARTACFLVGAMDSQGWILPVRKPPNDGDTVWQVADDLWSLRDDWSEDELHLARWLRVNDPDEFNLRARGIASSHETWEWIVATQRALLERRWNEHRIENMIERQLGLDERYEHARA